nr:hypothetical protein [Tanacetum cinerariifolium]
MANLSKDIQRAGSDTRPPMLDRTDFASWQQRIRLYCRGKKNVVNILKSIYEGPYQMGTVRETFVESTKGAPQFGPERPRVYSDLTPEEKDRYNADIRATNILLQGLPNDIYTLINHYTNAKDIWDNHKGESIHNYYVCFAKLINDMRNIKMTMPRLQLNSKLVNNMLPEWGRFVIANLTNTLALLTQSYKTFLPQTNNQLRTSSNARNQATVQDGRVVVQNVQGRQNRGQRMNPRGGGAAGYRGAQNRVGNVTQGQARPNSEYYKDKMLLMQAQENEVALDEEELLFLADPVTDEVGPSYDSNILSEVQDHDHYQEDVCAHHEEHAMHDSVQLDHIVDSHADYTSDSNMIPYDQSMVEEVTFLKNDFTQKENKYLEDFLDMKSLKEKVKDRLIKQDQSLQIVHMLCRPKPHYNELNKVAIGYKNPLCLTRAKQVQPALYNGHEIIKDNHALAIVHNTEDTLEIAEITRNKMNGKMNDPEYVTRKVKIAPHDYSKENFLATFTPQKQLTPEQIFWSNDLIKLKSEALKERTKVSRPIKALTVKKQVTFANQCDTSNSNTHKHVAKLNTQKTNVPVPPSTGVNRFTDASGSQPMSNTKKNKISPAEGFNKMQVEE